MKALRGIAHAVRTGRVNAYFLRGRYDRAAKFLESLCVDRNGRLREIGDDELERGGAYFIDLGLCYVELRRYTEAVRVFSHAYQKYRSFCRSFEPQSMVQESYREFLNAFVLSLHEIGDAERAREVTGEKLDYVYSNARAREDKDTHDRKSG